MPEMTGCTARRQVELLPPVYGDACLLSAGQNPTCTQTVVDANKRCYSQGCIRAVVRLLQLRDICSTWLAGSVGAPGTLQARRRAVVGGRLHERAAQEGGVQQGRALVGAVRRQLDRRQQLRDVTQRRRRAVHCREVALHALPAHGTGCFQYGPWPATAAAGVLRLSSQTCAMLLASALVLTWVGNQELPSRAAAPSGGT